MIVILSPSKTLDFKRESRIPSLQEPRFLAEAAKVNEALAKLKPRAIEELLNVSKPIAELTALRASEWKYPVGKEKQRAALAAFRGDVYLGLEAWQLDEEGIRRADKMVRILSGLYGLLKPTDIMLPHRMEMGTPLKIGKSTDLYKFWGTKITRALQEDLDKTRSKTLINLASKEYAAAVDLKVLKARVITPMFKEYRNGTYKFITFSGKKARGLMTRYLIDNNPDDPEALKLFDYEGWSFSEPMSKGDDWMFVR